MRDETQACHDCGRQVHEQSSVDEHAPGCYHGRPATPDTDRRLDLEAITERARVAGLSWNDGFEEYAARFYAETGMMAPGKDDRYETHSREERQEEWEAWRRHEWAQEHKAAVADRAALLAEVERLRAHNASLLAGLDDMIRGLKLEHGPRVMEDNWPHVLVAIAAARPTTEDQP